METRTAIVTGGSRGIGLAITEAFVNAGYSVIVGARSETEIEKRFPGKVRFLSTDVCEERAHKRLTALAKEWTGRVDAYINNAGFSEWRPIELVDEEFFEFMISTNLKGAFWGCKAAVEVMTGGGSIVNVSSIAGKRGSSNNSVYCASKFGINGLTQALSKEVGKRAIRVNGVCPVLVSTEGLLTALKNPHGPAKGDTADFLTRFAADNAALGRLPEASEVASLCVFLSSDAASAITGQSINVDCGVFPQ